MSFTKLSSYIKSLIEEGDAVAATKFSRQINSFQSRDYVDLELFSKWKGNCNLLTVKLGSACEPWKSVLEQEVPNYLVHVVTILGTVKSIQEAVAGDHLASYRDLVVAEAFANLLEQAEHLLSMGYWLAAGILGRAVLEEELREYASSANCFPQKARPTISDLNAELYKVGVYDKLEFKLIDSLAAIGNECAHNLSGVTEERVRHLLTQLSALLPRISP